MGYRNDHDAALARVDALETELEQMALEHEKTRTALAGQKPVVVRSGTSGAVAAAFLAMAALGVSMTVAMLRKADDPEVTVPVPVAVPAAVALAAPEPSPYYVTADLASCLAGVEASMHNSTRFDAETTDPRGAIARSPQSIIALGARCRPALDEAVRNLALRDTARALLARWVEREDDLAGAISRITVYYGLDPYALDGYASAGQLWRELDRARESRDALIVAERPNLRDVVSY